MRLAPTRPASNALALTAVAALAASSLSAAAAAGCDGGAPPPSDSTAPADAGPPPNRAPTLDGLFVSPAQPLAGTPALLTALVRDDSDMIVLTAWSVEAGDVEADQFGAVWHTPSVPGAVRVTFTAEDAEGARVEAAMYVPVLAPPPPIEPGDNVPVVLSVTAVPDFVYANETTVLTVVATDPDGDPLTYTWLSPPGELIPAGDTAQYVAFEGACIPGYYAFSVLVDDGRGGITQGVTSVWIDPN